MTEMTEEKRIARSLALRHQQYRREFETLQPGGERDALQWYMVGYAQVMQEHLTEQGVAYTPPELPGETGYWTHVIRMGDGEESMTYKEEDK